MICKLVRVSKISSINKISTTTTSSFRFFSSDEANNVNPPSQPPTPSKKPQAKYELADVMNNLSDEHVEEYFRKTENPIEELNDEILHPSTLANEIETTATSSSNAYKKSGRFRLATILSEMMPDVCPSTTSMILFPGQGSQFVGMGKLLLSYNNPTINRMFESASSILNRNMKKLCLEGPEDKLDMTIHCQPAVYLTSLAAAVHLREQSPQLIERCVAVAGYSLGEITALAFAGAFDFEDGLHVIRVRAEAMQRACDATPGAMCTVFLTHQSQLSLLIKMAKEYCKKELKIAEPICAKATHLYPECIVLSGHREAIEFVEKFHRDYKIRRTVRLPVSGAFHSALMNSAKTPVKNALLRLEMDGRLQKPQIFVLSNFDAMPIKGLGRLINISAKQVASTIQWHECMQVMFARPNDLPFPQIFEAGPGRQLGAILKACNRNAFSAYHKVDI